MKRTNFLSVALLASGALWAAKPAQAEDASWGCQVLLCAASSNPSWQGVPYCVPPMKRLIAAMAKPGFDWPICHEAKAGAPGREEYEDCPAGFHVGYTESGHHDDFGRDPEPNRCVQTMNRCENRSEFQRRYGNEAANERAGIIVSFSTGNSAALTAHRSDSCMVQISAHRPRRANPYYFDIPNDKGAKQRFWFNLND